MSLRKRWLGLKTWVNDLSVKGKMMLTFGLVVILPILFVGIFLTSRMKTMAYKQSMDEVEAEIERIANQVNQEVAFAMTLQNEVIAEPKLYDVIHREDLTTYDIFMAYNAFDKFKDYESTYAGIEDMRIYVENKHLLNNLDFMMSDPVTRNSWWYRQAVLNEGEHLASYHVDAIKGKGFLMITKGFVTSKGKQAVMMTLMNLDHLGRILEDEVHDVYLIDRAGMILASHDDKKIGSTLYSQLGVYGINQADTWRDMVGDEKTQMLKRNPCVIFKSTLICCSCSTPK